MSAWKWLHRQMDSLVALQVMIPIERLWALIALERSFVLWLRLPWMMAIYLASHWRILHLHVSSN
jgi:hypothetical protein